jgi:hypothetical protein
MGGKGDIIIGFENFPYQKHAPHLKELLIVLAGYHIGGFFSHLFGTRKSDFIEMALHHVCAIYLYCGCYLLNGWEFGQTVALLHDIADIFVNSSRMFSESRFKHAAVISFVMLLGSWFWTRVFNLPFMIMTLANYEQPKSQELFDPFVRYFVCWLLFCMWMLHCSWFWQFCLIGHKLINKG